MIEVELIEREGFAGRILVDEYPDMPDFDGDGHIIELDYRRDRADVRNVDCLRSGEAEELAGALSRAVAHWGFDWEKIERYLRSFYDVISLDWTHWSRDSHLVAVATRGLARDGWGRDDDEGEVLLAPYKAYRDGEVYGYVVEDPDGNELEALWGFYGDDTLDDVRSGINSVIDSAIAERRESRFAMYRRLINSR